MSSQNGTVLLNRLLQLKEQSPLILILDSLAQSSYSLVQEFAHHLNEQTNVIFISFETVNQPGFANHFINGFEYTVDKLCSVVNSLQSPELKNLIIIDCINYIQATDVTKIMGQVIRPNSKLLTVFHSGVPESEQVPNLTAFPTMSRILTYFASSIFHILPLGELDEDVENSIAKLNLVKGLNSPIFRLNLINRRKSGRSLNYSFEFNTHTHTYTQIVSKPSDSSSEDTQELLKNLTTFNLTTSDKQKLAKEQVELPYLDAQNEGFVAGGAIVYEFEKDDDYDEEDPYEDPF